MRCQGLPERDSSWFSSGNRTITASLPRYRSARNNGSPPADGGVRQSSSPRMNSNGASIFSTYVIGDRSTYSCGFWKGGFVNQLGVNKVKSAVYQNAAQSEMSRCDTAALKRVVGVTIQFVRRPPPLPPVTPMRPAST